ncbi:hypothetical protein ACQ5SO_20970 [Rhodovulum sp. DZ06]|uniref:hypothetical protein n=1 Tax=Rhodovulum sp. DZ06 TaxID=3425126 RepID=UPI003D332A2D
MHPALRFACAVLIPLLPAQGALAQDPAPPGGNLVVNGDFETGDLRGWTALRGEMVLVPAEAAGFAGVDPAALGAWTVTSAEGPEQEEIGQDVDLSAHAAEIDDDILSAGFSALVQTRRARGLIDHGAVSLVFLDAGGAALPGGITVRPSPTQDSVDWTAVDWSGPVPPGARTARIRFAAERASGASSDAFADAFSLVLEEPSSSAAPLR